MTGDYVCNQLSTRKRWRIALEANGLISKRWKEEQVCVKPAHDDTYGCLQFIIFTLVPEVKRFTGLLRLIDNTRTRPPTIYHLSMHYTPATMNTLG